MAGVSSKYTIRYLPNTFTVFGTQCTDVTTKNLAHAMSTQYTAKGAIGIRKQVSLIRRKLISNPSFWTGKDRKAIMSFWSQLNWGELAGAPFTRAALFAVTDVL